MLRVSIQSLPRCDIFNFTDEILASKINLLSAGYKKEQNESKDLLETCADSNDEMLSSPLKKKSCIKDLDMDHHLQTLNENNLTNTQNSLMDVSKPSTSRTLVEQVARNCDQNLLISPKISQENLKESYLKIRSLSEGTAGVKLETNPNNCCGNNLQTKLVSLIYFTYSQIIKFQNGDCLVTESIHSLPTEVIGNSWGWGFSETKKCDLKEMYDRSFIGIARGLSGS